MANSKATAARRAAAIDVGSNSVRLLAADVAGGEITPVARARETTRLMEGVADGLLSRTALERTANAIARMAREARERGADYIVAFGTSALRDSRNREELSDLTERLCGLRVRLVPGELEAELAYSGAAAPGKSGVIDIGGGSTELLYGEDGAVKRALSARIGAVRLKGLLGECGEAKMLDAAREALRKTADEFADCAPERWTGVGGTLTTLATLTMRVPREEPDAGEGCSLTRELVADWFHRLSIMTLDERKTLIGLSTDRADIIPYGAAIALAAMDLMRISRITATNHDNLEGALRLFAAPSSCHGE